MGLKELEGHMDGATIFILCLTAGMGVFAAYLSHLSRKNRDQIHTGTQEDTGRGAHSK